jgi:hypothetical protein
MKGYQCSLTPWGATPAAVMDAVKVTVAKAVDAEMLKKTAG